MWNDGVERKVLEKIKKEEVVRKTDLINLIRDDVERPRNMINAMTRTLTEKGWIIPLYAYESTFAITQKGIRELSRI